MRAVRGLVAGLVTLLFFVASAGASAPTAAAEPGDPVDYTVGCGFVEVTNQSTDPVIVVYLMPVRAGAVFADGEFDLAPSAMRRIDTTRKQFMFLVLNLEGTRMLQQSPILKPQDCPRVTAKTPRITGKTRVGEILTASAAGWAPADVQLSYQWCRSGRKIAGATAGTFTLTKADKGKKITVKVTGAHDGYFSVSKASKATSKVKAGILVALRPTIAGVAVVGSSLNAMPGAWGPAGVTLSYQWYRNGKKISKAAKAEYVLVKKDLGKMIRVTVTGRLAGYNTVARTSASTVKVGSR